MIWNLLQLPKVKSISILISLLAENESIKIRLLQVSLTFYKLWIWFRGEAGLSIADFKAVHCLPIPYSGYDGSNAKNRFSIFDYSEDLQVQVQWVRPVSIKKMQVCLLVSSDAKGWVPAGHMLISDIGRIILYLLHGR